jgi:hypothetical protein
MNTSQLIQVMEQDRKSWKKFCGVFSSDLLPSEISRYPCGLIVNTDPQTEKGTHWLAMYFPSKETGEFFDSYGQRPEFYHKSFEQYLNNDADSWTYNHRCLQSITSSTCGQFCLYFIMNRNRGKSLPRIVNSFSRNTMLNDHRVSYFVQRFFNFVKPKKTNKNNHQTANSLQHTRKNKKNA